MRAFTFRRYGGVDELRLEEISRPEPKPDEVLVRVKAVSLNDWDYELLHGRPFVNRLSYGMSKPKISILGSDIAGVVEAVGEDVVDLEIGDAVFGDLSFEKFGGFADYVCAPEKCLHKKPEGMSFEEAAAIPQAGMLCFQALFDAASINMNKRILINGAGGGVGTFALQILQPFNPDITVVDREEKLDRLIELGANCAFDYRNVDFTRTGETYDIIIDVQTRRSAGDYARALEKQGVYVSLGGDIGKVFKCLFWSPFIFLFAGKHLKVVMLKPNRDLAFFADQYQQDLIKPVIDSVFAFDDLPRAMEKFGASLQVGKIVVTMSGKEESQSA